MKCRKRKCVDVCHDWLGRDYEEYNDLGDVVILINIGLLLLSLPHIETYWIGRIFGLLLALMVFREAVSLLTYCESNVNLKKRPMLGGDHRTYIISGHLTFVMMTTYLIFISQVSPWIQLLALFNAFCIFFIQIITLEHDTCDMLITALLVWLLLKAYC